MIAGDENADPLDGDSATGAIRQLPEHPLVNTKASGLECGCRGSSAWGRTAGSLVSGQKVPAAAILKILSRQDVVDA